MGWSNIYCQIIGVTGPIIGEGLLHGFQTSIELDSFSWQFKARQTALKGDVKTALGAMKSAANALNPLRGVNYQLEAGDLTFEKRLDIASSDMHTMMDLGAPILTVSITVLHIAHSKGSIHQPGFVFLAADCKLKTCSVAIDKGERGGVDVKETWTVDFQNVTLTYLKSLGDNQIPMPPFFYIKPLAEKVPKPPGT